MKLQDREGGRGGEREEGGRDYMKMKYRGLSLSTFVNGAVNNLYLHWVTPHFKLYFSFLLYNSKTY